MTTFAYQVRIEKPSEEVWAVLAEFGEVHAYSPGVRASRTTSQATRGAGASRHCDLKPAGSVEERILEWREGRGYSLEVYDGKGSPPFERLIATYSLEPHRAHTIVRVRVDYGLKLGLIGALMDRMFVGTFLRNGIKGLLAGLKRHTETGEEISSTKRLELAAVTT